MYSGYQAKRKISMTLRQYFFWYDSDKDLKTCFSKTWLNFYCGFMIYHSYKAVLNMKLAFSKSCFKFFI